MKATKPLTFYYGYKSIFCDLLQYNQKQMIFSGYVPMEKLPKNKWKHFWKDRVDSIDDEKLL